VSFAFSCYRRSDYLCDDTACAMFIEELEKSRKIYSFKLRAYVLMPGHVHLFIWPENTSYNSAKILSGTKGIMSKRYSFYLQEKNKIRYDDFCINKRGRQSFIFWQPGGGFDRNLWNGKAIHDSIKYIENNPVRSHLVATPVAWKWSSAYTRFHKIGLIPDEFAIPVLLPNAQAQRIGVV
jgi:putative transposase